MNSKSFFNFLRSKFFWINIAAAVAIVIVLCLIIMLWLRSYTHHNEAVEVPDLSGLYVEEAELLLQQQNLGYEVIDSVYLKKLNPGEITEQSPVKGTKVKKNRKVYLTINAKGVRMIPVPELRNVSYRQASLTLQNMGFVVNEIVYKPSEFADLVMDITANEASVPSGTMMKEGSALTLVVGTTDSEEEVIIPNFKGLELEEAKRLISESQLILGIVDYDTDPAADHKPGTYYVYDQDPIPGQVHKAGKRVNLWFSKDKNHKPRANKVQDEDFFN